MRVERKPKAKFIHFADLKPGATFESCSCPGSIRMKVDLDCLRGRYPMTNIPEYLAVNLSNGVLVGVDSQAEVRLVNIIAVEE